MPLPPGTRLGPYEVSSKLGAGGMGEVYRAKDTKLNRDVALKILPEAFTGDADRLARFKREAQVLASLNHPNIAAIYGIEDSGVTHALVMELVDGEDLSAVIGRGAMPLADVLPIARQIADALETAHEQGIVHRDLKPANIKLRADGTVKVLDFGLAKAVDLGATSGPEAMNSPTMTARATAMGMVIGTAAYMAPEQARGRAVDRRADIWAFGVVLFEMLTGRRCFEGEDISVTLANVIKESPDWTALPASVPAHVQRVLRRCLEKEPKRRLSSISDARFDLDDTSGDAASPAPSTAGPGSRGGSPVLRVAAGLLLLGAGALAAWLLKPAPAAHTEVTRFSIWLAPNQQLNTTAPNVAISPDGRTVAYRASRAIWVRSLDDVTPRELVKSPGVSQWFSPDGTELLFTTLSGLSKIPVAGGSPRQIVENKAVSGADWAADGTIVFTDDHRLMRLPGDGGQMQVLLDTGSSYIGVPQVLPDGSVLFTLGEVGTGARVYAAMVLAPGATKPTRVLENASGARYLPTGHLVYGSSESQFTAVPFDLKTMKATGPAVVVAEPVTIGTTRMPQAVVSDTGVLAYINAAQAVAKLRLAWVDPQGRSSPALEDLHNYSDLSLSRDGRRAAMHLWEDDNDIWVADLKRSSVTRLTFTSSEEETPVISPDGQWVAYATQRDAGTRVLARKSIDGGAASPETVLWKTPFHFHVNDWSLDGKTILVETGSDATLNDILAIDVASGKVTTLLNSRYAEIQSRLSPDGRWLAYVSNESGRSEVYVQPYPALNARVQVSVNGGVEPVWSHDGRRLYFRSDADVMAATVTKPSPIEFDDAKVLFADTFIRTQGTNHTHYAVGADGRFLFVASGRAGSADIEREEIRVVLNWSEALKKLAPAKK